MNLSLGQLLVHSSGNGRVPEEPDWLRDAPAPYDNKTSPRIIGKSVRGEVGGSLRERNAAEIRADAAAGGGPTLDYLPFLEIDGYIVRGWSHLIAGYPKAGKTELLTRLCLEWQGERVIYFTEEPESVWAARLTVLPGEWSHVTLCFALGIKPESILARIRQGSETVVIIDTVRNLLSIRDETDNSEVARVLNPFIATARKGSKTLLMAHHLRKGGGEHGEGITGGHAFLGVVDIALEIGFADGNAANRRRVRGFGRIISVPELVYQQTDDKSFQPLGAPDAVALEEVKRRILAVLNGNWQTLKQICGGLDEPTPSERQVQNALDELTKDGLAERDPQQRQPGKTYKYRTPTSPRTSPPYMQGEVLEGEQSK